MSEALLFKDSHNLSSKKSINFLDFTLLTAVSFLNSGFSIVLSYSITKASHNFFISSSDKGAGVEKNSFP